MKFSFLLASLFIFQPSSASVIASDHISISTIQAGSSRIAITSSVYVTAGASLTISGQDSTLTTASSMTASAFFGDGGQLSRIASLTANQSMSGAATFSSSFTVNSLGGEIVLSTSSSIGNLAINSDGSTSFTPNLHNSSSTVIPDATTTNQYCGPCVSGSTLTITTTGGKVEIVFSGTIGNNDKSSAIVFLQDGSFVGNLGSDAVLSKAIWLNAHYPLISSHYVVEPTAGQHSYCLSLCTNVIQNPTTAELFNDATHTNIFYVMELK